MPEAQIREQAHRLIDFMAPGQVTEIVGLMRTMLSPLERSLVNAPFDDEPVSKEEALEVKAAHASLNRGEGIAHQDILTEFGLDMTDLEERQTPLQAHGNAL